MSKPKAIVWSQTNCQYCGITKALLANKGYEVEERLIGSDQWTKKDLIEAVPNARTVPQVFIDGKYIGSYQAVKEFLLNIE